MSIIPGRGRPRRQRKREECPKCSKLGLGPYKIIVVAGVGYAVRSCRYCQHTERSARTR